MNGAIDLLLRSIPILIGGGAVQLIIHLIKRRAEVRSLDATSLRAEAESGQFAVQSARESVELSNLIRDQAMKIAADKEAEAASEREEAAALRRKVRELTIRLETVEATLAGVEVLRAEVRDLRAENAQLKTEVEICRRTHPAGEVR